MFFSGGGIISKKYMSTICRENMVTLLILKVIFGQLLEADPTTGRESLDIGQSSFDFTRSISSDNKRIVDYLANYHA